MPRTRHTESEGERLSREVRDYEDEVKRNPRPISKIKANQVVLDRFCNVWWVKEVYEGCIANWRRYRSDCGCQYFIALRVGRDGKRYGPTEKMYPLQWGPYTLANEEIFRKQVRLHKLFMKRRKGNV